MTEGVLYSVYAQLTKPYSDGVLFRRFVEELKSKGFTVLSEINRIDGVPFTFMVVSKKMTIIEIERIVIEAYRKYDLPILDTSKDKGFSQNNL